MITPNNMPSHPVPEAPKPQPRPKPVFVRKEHLTARPLNHHPGLEALKASLPQNRKQGKR